MLPWIILSLEERFSATSPILPAIDPLFSISEERPLPAPLVVSTSNRRRRIVHPQLLRPQVSVALLQASHHSSPKNSFFKLTLVANTVAIYPQSARALRKQVFSVPSLTQSHEPLPATFTSPPIAAKQDSSPGGSWYLCSSTVASDSKIKDMYIPSDDSVLSDYQTLFRKQIEYFIARQEDIAKFTPNRKRNYRWYKSAFVADIAQPYALRGGLMLPSTFHSLPSAQNTVMDHFSDSCEQIDPRLRQQRFVLQWKRSRSSGAW